MRFSRRSRDVSSNESSHNYNTFSCRTSWSTLFIRLQNIIDSQNPLMFHVKLLTYSPFCHPLIIHICLFVVRSLRVTNKNIMAVSSCFLVALCNFFYFPIGIFIYQPKPDFSLLSTTLYSSNFLSCTSFGNGELIFF